jgi:hypothetical protein
VVTRVSDYSFYIGNAEFSWSAMRDGKPAYRPPRMPVVGDAVQVTYSPWTSQDGQKSRNYVTNLSYAGGNPPPGVQATQVAMPGYIQQAANAGAEELRYREQVWLSCFTACAYFLAMKPEVSSIEDVYLAADEATSRVFSPPEPEGADL